MSYLDQDIKKLKKYANSLGLKVYTRKFTKFTGEAQYMTGTSITLFPRSKTTKSDIVMSLLHELGHHLDYMKNGLTNKEYEAAKALMGGKMEGPRPDLTKGQRRAIFISEFRGITQMSKIHKKLNLNIPFYKVMFQQELDLFQYKQLWKTGKFPTPKQCQVVRNKIGYYRKKYGK